MTYCIQCGTQIAGPFCWRCGTPAYGGDGSTPPAPVVSAPPGRDAELPRTRARALRSPPLGPFFAKLAAIPRPDLLIVRALVVSAALAFGMLAFPLFGVAVACAALAVLALSWRREADSEPELTRQGEPEAEGS